MHHHRHYSGIAAWHGTISVRCSSCPAWSAVLSTLTSSPFPSSPWRHLPVSCYANFMLSFYHPHKICSLTATPPTLRSPSLPGHVISGLHDNDTILTKLIMHNLNIFLAHCSCARHCTALTHIISQAAIHLILHTR